jgi:hypothetical protein
MDRIPQLLTTDLRGITAAGLNRPIKQKLLGELPRRLALSWPFPQSILSLLDQVFTILRAVFRENPWSSS